MKKLFLAFAALISVISLHSCKEEVELVSNSVETAIVYGLLDQSDSIHFVKINRAFIGPGNALEIAQIPDSNYFNTVVAKIEEVTPSGIVARSWNLKDTMITNKDQNGVFYAPEQKVYVMYSKSIDNSSSATNQPLNPDNTYRLSIDIDNGKFQISGETALVKNVSIPTNTGVGSLYGSFNFFQNNEYKTTAMTVNTGNSSVVNATLKFNYRDYTATDYSTYIDKSFNWNLGEQAVENAGTLFFSASGQTFYDLVLSNVTSSDPSIIRRRYTSVEIIVTGGSEDLYNYITLNQPASSLAQTKPEFTNLVATNDKRVIGIFSSRFTYSIFKDAGKSTAVRALNKTSTEKLCKLNLTPPFCTDHSIDAADPSLSAIMCP